ncbi:hypothetical protein [Microbacterium marmarense]|uniref:MarR family transcriptional regulator n=1 Tax=Microbacterium marmarense TaxID=3122051 RepID=A0ABU8LV23_9MICO
MTKHPSNQAAQFSPSGPSVIVPPGIPLRPIVKGWARVRADQISALEDGHEVIATLRVEYAAATGRFEVAAFGLERAEHPIEVSGAFFRTVQVHAIAKQAIPAAVPSWAINLTWLWSLRSRGGLKSFPEFALSDADEMLLTALIYRIAEISGENPAQAVADSIGLKQRTATNWIARARAAGYMTSTEHGAAARRLATAIAPLQSQYLSEEMDDFNARNNITADDIQALIEREDAAVAEAIEREKSRGND